MSTFITVVLKILLALPLLNLQMGV